MAASAASVRAAICCLSLEISASLFRRSSSASVPPYPTWTLGLFLMNLALVPNRRVEMVSATLKLLGLQAMMREAREVPPRESCRILVSFESL